MGKLGSWMLVMALVGGAFLFVGAPVPVRGANVSFSLFGSASAGWGNTSASLTSPGPTLVVHQGDSVSMTLNSQDGFAHQFLVDYNGNGVGDSGEPESATFSSTTTFTFTATQAGTFAYFCVIHPTAMKGTFIVLSSSGTTSTPPPSSTPTSSSPAPSSGLDTTLLILGAVTGVAIVAGLAIIVARRKH